MPTPDRHIPSRCRCAPSHPAPIQQRAATTYSAANAASWTISASKIHFPGIPYEGPSLPRLAGSALAGLTVSEFASGTCRRKSLTRYQSLSSVFFRRERTIHICPHGLLFMATVSGPLIARGARRRRLVGDPFWRFHRALVADAATCHDGAVAINEGTCSEGNTSTGRRAIRPR